MTLKEVQKAKIDFGNEFVKITLNDESQIIGVLQNAFSGNAEDPRGHIEPYLFVIRVDKGHNPTENLSCSEIKSIEKIIN